MIKTPLSIALGGAFWTPGCTVIGDAKLSFEIVMKKLFTNGEQGFAYDPNDLSTMYQDAAGTIPVTAAGQPVGLIRDKSGRNNHAYQAASASRPILQRNATTGAHYLAFDGADDYLVVAKGNLKFLHDGTGATGFVGFKPSGATVYHTLLNTGSLSNASVVGYALAQDDRVSGNIVNVVTNGARALHVNNVVAVGVSSNPRVVSFKNKLGTHVIRQNGSQVLNSSTETGSPSASASTSDLWIGRAPAGFSLSGILYGLICINRLTTDSEAVAIEKELAKRLGVTLNV